MAALVTGDAARKLQAALEAAPRCLRRDEGPDERVSGPERVHQDLGAAGGRREDLIAGCRFGGGPFAAPRNDNCAPAGRVEKGQFVLNL